MLKIRKMCSAWTGVCESPLSKPSWASLRHWAVGRPCQCQRSPCWAVSHSSHFDFRGQISPSRNCWLQPGLQMQGDCARCPSFHFIFLFLLFVIILFFVLPNRLFQMHFSKQHQTMFLLMGDSLQSPSLPCFKVNYFTCWLSLPSLPVSAHQCFLTQWTCNFFLSGAGFYLCMELPQNQPPAITEFHPHCHGMFMLWLFLFCSLRISLHFSGLHYPLLDNIYILEHIYVEIIIRNEVFPLPIQHS